MVTEFESTTWLAAIMVWDTGEAELTTVRLADDTMVNKTTTSSTMTTSNGYSNQTDRLDR